MDFNKFFKQEKAQKQIDKLAKKYKGKKVVVYGAGKYATCLFKNYDLSELNIVAVADKGFESQSINNFFDKKCISPIELRNFDCDVILLGVQDTFYFLDVLEEELLVDCKNSKLPIKPIVKQSFWSYIKSLFSSEK